MRYFTILIFTFFLFSNLQGQGLSTFINEVNYAANNPTETGFEIVGDAGLDLSGWSFGVYDASGTLSYIEFMAGVLPNSNNSKGYGWFEVDQSTGNGGIALMRPNGTVSQFLVYGTNPSLQAINGPAQGFIPEYIGNQSSPDASLQLVGTGVYYLDFIWALPGDNNPESINTNQIFTAVFRNSSVVEEEKTLKINAYPNPVLNILTVKLPVIADNNTSIIVTTALGQIIDYQKVAEGTVSASIDFSQINSGQYFITVENNNGYQTEHVVKL
jgi:hypothetical protein